MVLVGHPSVLQEGSVDPLGGSLGFHSVVIRFLWESLIVVKEYSEEQVEVLLMMNRFWRLVRWF